MEPMVLAALPVEAVVEASPVEAVPSEAEEPREAGRLKPPAHPQDILRPPSIFAEAT